MLKHWISAIRPHTLPASLCPVIAAGAYGWYFDTFRPEIIGICLVFALLAQIASNLANDYFDYKNGMDRENRVGPRRAVASGDISPKAMLFATLSVLGLACLVGCLLIYYSSWHLIWIGMIIVLFALAYSTGPYPLASHGLGDVTVFIFFGLIAVGLSYYLQAGTMEPAVWAGSAAIGLLSVNILMVNNYRDMETDALSGKRTTVVMFGRKWVKWGYFINGWLAVLLVAPFVGYIGLFMIPYLVMHVMTHRELISKKGTELNAVLARTAGNLFLFTVLLSLGLLILK
ncbi:MAG TPA: 1,4-dihydroxy-2-naphthoate octaprenyltransferase [Candidatus Avirikenella pullistercoris]|nr:1,4-dihydroxy-2-naphthoate octaprenyltransferase [Candidatus Avirikenella pullistercoris]